MSKLQNNQEIAQIHAMLDELPSATQITDSIVNELSTVQDVVRYLVSVFSCHNIFVGHGTDNYWDEALEIVQAVMHLQPPCDDSTLNSKLTKLERQIIAKIACQRIIERIPTPIYFEFRPRFDYFCELNDSFTPINAKIPSIKDIHTILNSNRLINTEQ